MSTPILVNELIAQMLMAQGQGRPQAPAPAPVPGPPSGGLADLVAMSKRAGGRVNAGKPVSISQDDRAVQDYDPATRTRRVGARHPADPTFIWDGSKWAKDTGMGTRGRY